MKRKIIIDTDPGHDDAMALMLACKSPELEVLAVTTVCGNSTIENTTRNARFVLGYIGYDDIPIYSGAEKPLERELIQAVVHGKSGLDGVDLPDTSALTGDAVEQILKIVKANPNEVTLVVLGPMTNIAAAIKRDPKTMGLVKEIVAMAGAIEVAGNKNRVAEFNVFADPEAADIVMNFPVSKTIVPLDACNQVLMSYEDIQQIKNQSIRRLLAAILQPYISNLVRDVGVNAALMYDPLTVFYLLAPGACKTTQYNIQIETKGVLTRGMTVADRRRVTDGLAANTTVVTNINSRRFIKRFTQTLSRSEQNST